MSKIQKVHVTMMADLLRVAVLMVGIIGGGGLVFNGEIISGAIVSFVCFLCFNWIGSAE